MQSIKNNALLVAGMLCLACVSNVAFANPGPEMDGELIGQVGLVVAGVVLIARRAMNKSKE